MRCIVMVILFASSMLTGCGQCEMPANSAKSRELKGHTDAIRCMAISPDGRWLVTGSDDTTARLWDLKRQ